MGIMSARRRTSHKKQTADAKAKVKTDGEARAAAKPGAKKKMKKRAGK